MTLTSNSDNRYTRLNTRQKTVAFDALTDTDKHKTSVLLSHTVNRAGGDSVRGTIALLRRDLMEPTNDPYFRGVRNRILRLIDCNDDGFFGFVCRFVEKTYGGIPIW